MKQITEYTVYLKMEDGEELSHEVKAEDAHHAEGLAIAWATKKTGKQVYDYDCEEGETYELISEDEAERQYNDCIDFENEISIFGMSYLASRVLKEIDPIAYNCGFSDFTDSLSRDGVLVEGYTD